MPLPAHYIVVKDNQIVRATEPSFEGFAHEARQKLDAKNDEGEYIYVLLSAQRKPQPFDL